MTKPSPESISHNLIQLHIAEYEAMATRGSYFMVMQFGLLSTTPAIPVLGIYLYGVFGSSKAKSLTCWITVVVLQLVAMLWANMMLEQFALVKYVECVLRPRIVAILTREDFWLYEPYLVKHRPVNSIWGTYSMAGSAVVAVLIVVLVRSNQFGFWDVFGLIANCVCLAILYLMSRRIGMIQHEWAICDKSLVDQL